MITKEKQKAVIEAMLFASAQPLPLNKMLNKIRQLLKKETVIQEEQSNREDLRARIDRLRVQAEALRNGDMPPEIPAPAEGLSDDIKDQLIKKQEELEQQITSADIKILLKEIQDELAGEAHGVELVTVAQGYQLRTKHDVSECLRDEKLDTPMRLTPSSLETLAIVAYEQPATRQRIEEIRGVDSGGVLKTLLEKGFVKVVGRSDEPGRPLVYGTSKKFLEVFTLNSLNDLPTLEDYHSLQLSSTDGKVQVATDEVQDIAELIDDEVVDLTASEKEILDDLDSSLQHLKNVEKDIMGASKKEETPLQ